jgi:hypothetical protein
MTAATGKPFFFFLGKSSSKLPAGNFSLSASSPSAVSNDALFTGASGNFCVSATGALSLGGGGGNAGALGIGGGGGGGATTGGGGVIGCKSGTDTGGAGVGAGGGVHAGCCAGGGVTTGGGAAGGGTGGAAAAGGGVEGAEGAAKPSPNAEPISERKLSNSDTASAGAAASMAVISPDTAISSVSLPHTFTVPVMPAFWIIPVTAACGLSSAMWPPASDTPLLSAISTLMLSEYM